MNLTDADRIWSRVCAPPPATMYPRRSAGDDDQRDLVQTVTDNITAAGVNTKIEHFCYDALKKLAAYEIGSPSRRAGVEELKRVIEMYLPR